jgi:pre-mRNA-processing factor 17
MWDTETGKLLNTFITGRLPYTARFCPDPAHGSDILVGQNDKKIIQWDTNSAQITQEYDQHLGPINTITFVDGNRRFVTTSDDKAIRVWEYGIPVTIKCEGRRRESSYSLTLFFFFCRLIAEPHMHSIPYVYPTPDGEYFLGQSLDNQVRSA